MAGSKPRYRQAAGIKRLQRGADIPIAVLVPRVVLRKRLAIARLVAECLPRLAVAVEEAVAQL